MEREASEVALLRARGYGMLLDIGQAQGTAVAVGAAEPDEGQADDSRRFTRFEEARAWLLARGGGRIVRDAAGGGYIARPAPPPLAG